MIEDAAEIDSSKTWEIYEGKPNYKALNRTFVDGANWAIQRMKPSRPTDEEMVKKSLFYSNNLYNSDDKWPNNILSEYQLWENSLRDYETGYKQALKDLGYEV